MISVQDVVSKLLLFFARDMQTLGHATADDLYEAAVSKTMAVALGAVSCKRGGQASDFQNIPEPLLNELIQALAHLNEGDSTAARLGTAFETIRGMELKFDAEGAVEVGSSHERRGKGIYFTPVVLAEALVKPALERVFAGVNEPQDLRRISVLDPAVGCGAFLLAIVRVGAHLLAQRPGFSGISDPEIRAQIATHCVFGVDIDPVAIATTRALLLAEVGLENWETEQLDRHLRVADSISAPLSAWTEWFPDVFPAGFNAIATNPPWSKLRPLRHEFFEHQDKRVRLYQGTDLGVYLQTHLKDLVSGSWKTHVEKTVELSRSLRESNEYILNTSSSGDPDMYKYFTERSLALLAEDGVAAILLPSGILRAQGSAGLRKLLRTWGTTAQLTEYLNRRKLFDIHSMYRFCTVLFYKGEAGGINNANFSRLQVEDNETEPLELDLSFLEIVGGRDLLIPEVRSAPERDILYRAFRRYPTVEHNDSGWKFNFRRELDMTNDAHLFVPSADAQEAGFFQCDDGCWRSPGSDSILLPLYEGRMVHQFDARAKTYKSGHGRAATWAVPIASNQTITPHYLVPIEYAVKRGWEAKARVAYCEISGHANERTVLAAMLPANSICGNKVPVLKLENGTAEDELLWLALANSLVVDWIMRRFVSTTVNHFYWRNIPLPSKGENPEAESLLIDAARRLSIDCAEPLDLLPSLGKRSQLRAVIDAIVLNMYGFTIQDLRVILDDFPKFNSAHKRGGPHSVSVYQLISRASSAFAQRELDLDELDRIFGCESSQAAASYTPSEKARSLARGEV